MHIYSVFFTFSISNYIVRQITKMQYIKYFQTQIIKNTQ